MPRSFQKVLRGEGKIARLIVRSRVSKIMVTMCDSHYVCKYWTSSKRIRLTMCLSRMSNRFQDFSFLPFLEEVSFCPLFSRRAQSVRNESRRHSVLAFVFEPNSITLILKSTAITIDLRFLTLLTMASSLCLQFSIVKIGGRYEEVYSINRKLRKAFLLNFKKPQLGNYHRPISLSYYIHWQPTQGFLMSYSAKSMLCSLKLMLDVLLFMQEW